jgi:hypothetical protein
MPVRIGAGGLPVLDETPTRSLDYSYVGWVDPTGKEWSLVDPDRGYSLIAGVLGFGSQKITINTAARARGGVGILSTRYEPRLLTLPILVAGMDHTEFLELWEELEDAFTRTSEDGPGYLRVVRPDGRERRVDAVFYDGWDNGQGDDWSFDAPPVQLLCPRGYWYDPTPATVVREAVTGLSFFAPYMRVSSGNTLGDSTLVNSGQLKTYPTWTVTGPMTALEASITYDFRDDRGRVRSVTETFTVTHTLTGGQQITITTDPPALTDDAGDSIFSDLTMPGSTLWGIPRGTSDCVFTVTGSGAGTKVELSYLKRFKQA